MGLAARLGRLPREQGSAGAPRPCARGRAQGQDGGRRHDRPAERSRQGRGRAEGRPRGRAPQPTGPAAGRRARSRGGQARSSPVPHLRSRPGRRAHHEAAGHGDQAAMKPHRAARRSTRRGNRARRGEAPRARRLRVEEGRAARCRAAVAASHRGVALEGCCRDWHRHRQCRHAASPTPRMAPMNAVTRARDGAKGSSLVGTCGLQWAQRVLLRRAAKKGVCWAGRGPLAMIW